MSISGRDGEPSYDPMGSGRADVRVALKDPAALLEHGVTCWRVNKRLDQHGLLTMTVLRLLPIAPFAMVNSVAGAAAIRTRDYLFGSLFGMAPGVVLMTVSGDRLGAWLRQPDPAHLVLVLIVAALAFVLTWALRRWSRRRTPA
jgi:phospholipase D1/2